MRKLLFLLPIFFIMTACVNKELCEECCEQATGPVKVVVNWEDTSDARAMRMNLFSATDGVLDYGRDNIPLSGTKYITLTNNASYRPYCYDYYASNIYFRDETALQYFEAYLPQATRNTYNTLATPVPGEATVLDPGGDFFVHSWQEPFDVLYTTNEQVLNFYPKNLIRPFTFRINNVGGAQYITDAKGAISGVPATYYFYEDELTDTRSTILFEGAKTGTANGQGYIEGSFTSFAPVIPYRNRFTIEILTSAGYYTAYWDVSGQVEESMADRPAKLARDGYDILLTNDDDIPDIPDPGGGGGTGGSSGFEIGVGDWDEIEIYL